MKKLISLILAAFLITGITWSEAEDCQAGQGCCSYHGGECGCSGTHTMCCDGTVSHSCKC